MVTKPVGQKSNIESIATQRLNKTEAKDVDATVSGASAKANNYDVQLSELGKKRAEGMKLALEAAKEAPEVREELVTKYKNLIASGEYQADAGSIADGILREAIREELANRD